MLSVKLDEVRRWADRICELVEQAYWFVDVSIRDLRVP